MAELIKKFKFHHSVHKGQLEPLSNISEFATFTVRCCNPSTHQTLKLAGHPLLVSMTHNRYIYIAQSV
jgi:hypothetical protein